MAISYSRVAFSICFILAPTSAVAATVQDFGPVALNASPTSETLTYNFQGISEAPSFSLAWNRDFQAAQSSCTVAATTNCSIVVTFAPLRPGLRQDVLLLKNQSGDLLTSTPLRGIGTAPLMVLTPGVISTLAGTGVGGYYNSPNQNLAQFWNPQAVVIDSGHSGLYVADTINAAIRRIDLTNGAVTTVAGTGGTHGYSGDGGPATSASLNTPTGVAIDGAGNLFIADQGNNVIRRVDAVSKVITTVAGGSITPSGNDTLGDGGPATSAILWGPLSVAVDSPGNLYIADTYHQLVRAVNAATGVISVVAGGGTAAGNDGFGDGEPAISAQLANPSGVAVDSTGNLYIADTGDNLIRRVDATTGIITAVAGNGVWGYSGDFGLATNASLASPQAISIDAGNNLYIADYGNNAIRRVSASSNNIATIAGKGSTGYSGDGGNPTLAFLTSPMGIAVDENGDLFIGDSGNNVIRHIAYAPTSFEFGTEPVGALSTAQTISPFNVGNLPLNLSNISVPTNFQQVPSGTSDCATATVLAPGAGCNVAIAFAPVQTGTISGSISLLTNSLNNAASEGFGLTGIGATTPGPALSLSASSITFSAEVVASSSAAQTVTITNSGGSDFDISGIALSGTDVGDFQISTTCGSSLAAGASCAVSITFTPTAVGTRSATLLLSDSVVGTPQSISLSGIAASSPASVALSATTLSFTPQLLSTTSAAQTITLSNPGGLSLTISSISLSFGQTSDYQLSTTCGSSLAAGANCAISIAFAPTASGYRMATLQVSDSSAVPTQTVNLSGMGAMRTHCPSCDRAFPLETGASPRESVTTSYSKQTPPVQTQPAHRLEPRVAPTRRAPSSL